MTSDRFTVRPGWIVVGKASGMSYGVGKGWSFAEAAAFSRDVLREGHLRPARRWELRRRQEFLDRIQESR